MTAEQHPSTPVRGVLGWCGQVLAWLVILGVGATLVVSVLIPRVVGGTPYVILTGSMQPAMPPGTLVVDRPVRHPQDIGVGTVVTYQLNSGEPTVVTHRVRKVLITSTGKYRFQTQGDANSIPDAKLVMPVQIRGERWYYVPYLGYVTNFFSGSQKHLFAVLAVIGLLGYAAWMFLGAARDRVTGSRSRTAPIESPREAELTP